MNSNKTSTERLAWRPTEVAAMFGFSLGFIRKEIRAGRLKAVKFGSRLSIFQEDIEAYKNRQKQLSEKTNGEKSTENQ